MSLVVRHGLFAGDGQPNAFCHADRRTATNGHAPTYRDA
jgi:hypothetical protein